MKLLLILILVISLSPSFASSDRIERAKVYYFIFQNNETIKLENPSAIVLNSYNNDIINGKRKLVAAVLAFATGEILTIKHDGHRWYEINIRSGRKIVEVPFQTLKKISEIHFASVSLLWNGDYKKSFDANYFYIRFNIGREKPFNEYPCLELHFSNKKYQKAEIWKQIDKNTKQDYEF